MIKKILFSLLIGFILTLFFSQYDPWTHKKISMMLQNIAQESLGGNCTCTIQSVNFFIPSLILSDIRMTSNTDQPWSWQCKRCEIHGSWLQLLFKGIMDQHIIMEDFECTTEMEKLKFSIEDHVTAMMTQPLQLFSTQIKSALFKNGTFSINNPTHKINITLFFNSSSLRIGDQVKTTMSIGDGICTHQGNTIFEKYTADISLITHYKNNVFDIGLHTTGGLFLPQLTQQGNCYVTGNYQSGNARFSIRNAYNSIVIEPIIMTESEIRLRAQFPLHYCAHHVFPSFTDQIINGTGNFSIKIQKNNFNSIEGHLILEDFTTKRNHMCDVSKIMFSRTENEWKIRTIISRYNQELKGSGYWNEITKKGELLFKNSTDLYVKAFSHWRIKYNNFFLRAMIDGTSIQGTWNAPFVNTINALTHTCTGSFKYNNTQCLIDGLFDSNTFAIDTTLYPQININSCIYKDSDKKELINISCGSNSNTLEGTIAFPFIRSLVNHYWHYDIQGEGSIAILAKYSFPIIDAYITSKDTTIRLGKTYNFLDEISTHCICDIRNNQCIFYNNTVSLHTGNINCLKALVYFDEKGLVFAHVPLIFNHCLFNIKKDLFAIISGSFLFSYKKLPEIPHVQGFIIVDKAHLKENIFSGVIQKKFVSHTTSLFSLPTIPLQFDLDIITKSPIYVDSGFLKTNAHVNLHMKKNTHEPSINGSIILQSGTLNVPYKPLYISKGAINFIAEQPFDPLIELTAHNKIKKYDVSLHVGGSLLNHHITLDSNPALSEEQIMGLLLVGSEEQSLNNMMPALLAQNVKNFIFSNNQASFFDKYFKPLLGSLSINLVPSFSDQTGRGGLRGAVEITVNDRLRAVIQKNFSLTEDTKFELEFLLSDDITLRAIRDERRDIGGEIEMKWKF